MGLVNPLRRVSWDDLLLAFALLCVFVAGFACGRAFP